jgi:3-hydroxyisobutyrate dehydrogenase-like beta-hydroxyacid dehydrogenase
MSLDARTAGIVGLGQIGGGVAAALHNRGWSVVGHDPYAPARERLADVVSLAPSPRAVAELTDVVLVAVLDDAQIRAVLTGPDGIIAAATPPRAVGILSTIGLDTLGWAAEALHGRGIGIVDCGVSGGAAAARTGQLVAMLGGEASSVEAVRPAVEAFCSLVVHVGGLGDGLRVKLARNLVTYGSWMVAEEAARLVAACGIPVASLVQVIRGSDAMTGGVTGLIGAQASSGHSPQALAAIAEKDLGAALSLAAQLGLELPVTRFTAEHFDRVVGLDGSPSTSPKPEERA